MQRLEQVVLGVGTNNGLLREVKEMRAEMAERLDTIDASMEQEQRERKAEWAQFYSRLAIWFVGGTNTVDIAFVIDKVVS